MYCESLGSCSLQYERDLGRTGNAACGSSLYALSFTKRSSAVALRSCVDACATRIRASASSAAPPSLGSVRSGQSFVSFSPCGAVSTSSASAFGCALEDPAGARGSSGNSSSSLASMREFRFRAPRCPRRNPGPRSQVPGFGEFFCEARDITVFAGILPESTSTKRFLPESQVQVPGCGEFPEKKIKSDFERVFAGWSSCGLLRRRPKTQRGY